MPRNSLSQMTATNPLNPNGISNVLLQPPSNEDSGQGFSMTLKDLKNLLQKLSNPTTEVTEDHINSLKNAQKFFSEFAKDLNALLGAFQNNTDSPPTRDPYTNDVYRTGPQLAEDLLKVIEEKMNDNKVESSSNRVFNLSRYAAKSKSREEKDKKKTRGNPFRVLMGQVGKLLDHGISKKDIVRYIAKKNMWNEETISKAVDVVSDYSKKKRKKEKKFQEKEAFYNESNQRTAAIDAKVSIYDVDPDFAKRSTAELMARATWLKDLMNYGVNKPQGDSRKVADKNGASAELRKIREALKLRGFEENELP